MVDAWSAGDYDAVRALVHPDCVVESHAHGEFTIVGCEHVIEQLESMRGTLWAIGPMRVKELDEDMLLSHATVRMPLGSGGHSVSSIYWLTTYRDGRIARTQAFRSEADALAARDGSAAAADRL